jgi:hypothetical protein
MTPEELCQAERLRREMEGCVTGLRIPPSLITGMLRRHTWRKRRKKAALITGPLAVAGVGAGIASLLAAGGVHLPRPVAPPVRLTASYVITLTARSLNENTGQAISEVRGTGPGSLRWTQWDDQATRRSDIEWFGPGGELSTEAVTMRSGRKALVTLIDFRQKSWVRYAYVPASSSSVPSAGREFQSLPSGRAGFQALISSGSAVIAGYQLINGTGAIELRITGQNHGPHRVTRVWINRTTYLPVRISIASTAPRWTVTEDITWLKRTPAILRRFTVSIPPGFSEVRHPLPGSKGGGQG